MRTEQVKGKPGGGEEEREAGMRRRGRERGGGRERGRERVRGVEREEGEIDYLLLYACSTNQIFADADG